MKIEIQVVIDGVVVLTQGVSLSTLDNEIYPLLEEEASR